MWDVRPPTFCKQYVAANYVFSNFGQAADYVAWDFNFIIIFVHGINFNHE